MTSARTSLRDRRERTWAPSTLARNVIGNYAATVWMAGVSIVSVPLYLKVLGPSEWGIVAACLTIQGVLGLLDAGFAQTMPRSIAAIAGDARRERDVFAAYSRVYACVALAGFVTGQACAGTVARTWFQAAGVAPAHIELAIRLALVHFAFQFANNAHVGYWNGTQLQGRANLRQGVATTVRHALALGATWLVSASAITYLVVCAAVAGMEWLLNRRSIAEGFETAGAERRRVAPGDLRRIAGEAGALTAGVLIGSLVTQCDRLVLSRTCELAQFGVYVIVANFGLSFLNLQYPLMRAYFPRIVREYTGGSADLRSSRRLWGAVVALCVVPCLLCALFSEQLLALWLRNAETARAGAAPLRLILIAVAVNGLYNVIYQRIVVSGASKVVIAINACGLVVACVMALSGPRGSIVLGGLIWVAAALTQLALGVTWARVASRAPALARST